MDYEKKYKNALEWARQVMNGETGFIRKEVEEVFPELAESKDEKIRKAIIHILKGEVGYTSKENTDKYVAWLEKHTYTQRDVDDAYLKGVTDTKNILGNRGKQTNFSQNVSLTEFEEALADVCRGWIGDEIGWKDYIVRNANALLKICQKMWNEVQDAPFEQKPINDADEEIVEAIKDTSVLDMVEPKFKVGNWYQCTKDFFGKGVTFDKNTAYYCAKEGCLQCEYGCHIAIVKDLYDNFKLWTIQDAKDGDVLTNGELILIFKQFEEPSYRQHIIAHVGLDISGDIQVTDGIWQLGIDKASPATKEQCDLLFQKMKEAGYEWDAENKDLKKIELTQSVTKTSDKGWSEEDENELYIVISTIESRAMISQLEQYTDMLYKSVEWLKSLKERLGG